MFPTRYLADRYFAPRYFPKVGADPAPSTDEGTDAWSSASGIASQRMYPGFGVWWYGNVPIP